MNLIYKIVAVVYRAYDDRGIDIPHFRALITIALILLLHAVQIGLLFNLPSGYIMPWNSEAGKSTQWLFGALYFGIVIALLAVMFRKSKLDTIKVSQKQIDRGRAILPIYLTLSIILLAVLLIVSGIEKGKINL